MSDYYHGAVQNLEERLELELFAHQEKAIFDFLNDDPETARHCLYHRTGAGKSITALGMLFSMKIMGALVIAPPSTHKSWQAVADKLGMTINTISHAKFRQKAYKIDKHVPIIADEVHMFGGNQGQGWKKLHTAARGLKAPVILASATPNYNDAERVYCIGKIIDPVRFSGGYLDFLYRECKTVQNHFSMTPDVEGFHQYVSASAFLQDLKGVHYLPDQATWDDQGASYLPEADSRNLLELGYDYRKHKMVASAIERKHRLVDYAILTDEGYVSENVMDTLQNVTMAEGKPVLIYADHSTVAEALSKTIAPAPHGLITGKTSKKKKDEILESFRKGELEFLIGTASLATGTDGIDKVCDLLVILDDTDDDSLRRQLSGRILPRGASEDQTPKTVVTLTPSW